jgi:hypothetical protein
MLPIAAPFLGFLAVLPRAALYAVFVALLYYTAPLSMPGYHAIMWAFLFLVVFLLSSFNFHSMLH